MTSRGDCALASQVTPEMLSFHSNYMTYYRLLCCLKHLYYSQGGHDVLKRSGVCTHNEKAWLVQALLIAVVAGFIQTHMQIN